MCLFCVPSFNYIGVCFYSSCQYTHCVVYQLLGLHDPTKCYVPLRVLPFSRNISKVVVWPTVSVLV